MKDELTENQKEDIIKALDDAIASGPWDQSNFLKAIGANLEAIKNEFVEMVNDTTEPTTEDAILAKRSELKSGQQEVYVSLYSAEGNNLNSWERILANLPKQLISRPVYENEKDIKNRLKSKEKKVNEAYVAIKINQSDILSIPADKVQKDKLGVSLLSLKDKSLDSDNITRFMHMSNMYHYHQGRLTKLV